MVSCEVSDEFDRVENLLTPVVGGVGFLLGACAKVAFAGEAVSGLESVLAKGGLGQRVDVVDKDFLVFLNWEGGVDHAPLRWRVSIVSSIGNVLGNRKWSTCL
jgi:hypothetical protein